MARVEIREALEGDLRALTGIYNHYVRETPITFDLEPFTVEARRPWFEGFGPAGRYRLLVAERDGGAVGYACSHRFRSKAAYDRSVETTVYLGPEAVGQGIGRRLYGALFEALAGEDVHRALAGMTLPNAASAALHAGFGFQPIGVFREVGYKFGRYWDVEWLEKAM
ncbi:MAG: GNAT family N-acetyltransferase [Myxococcota bacterium]|nr:GNAT family N-acetyltransferase [Myxococcota bacterium]